MWSTPTLPGHGIAAVFDKSDKKCWTYRCNVCNKWQRLTEDNIRQKKGPVSLVQRIKAHDVSVVIEDGTFAYVCVKCGQRINRINVPQRWQAFGSDNAEYSGYNVSQLDAVWISADKIMRNLLNAKFTRHWYNYDLGIPWLGEVGSPTKGWILTLVNPAVPCRAAPDHFRSHYTNLRVGVGIDWGKRNWAVAVAECEEWSKPTVIAMDMFVDTRDPDDTIRWALNFIERWQAIGIADAGHGHDRVPKLWQALGTRFFACQYLTGRRESRVLNTCEPSFGPNPPPLTQSTAVVTVDKTAAMKVLLSRIHRRDFAFANLGEENLLEFDRHVRNMAIVVEETKRGVTLETWRSLGDDHYLNCLLYADIALNWSKRREPHVSDVSFDGVVEDAFIDSGMPTGDDISMLASYFNDFSGS